MPELTPEEREIEQQFDRERREEDRAKSRRGRRGSRGAAWERLEIGFKIRWRSRGLYDSLTPKERARGRLTVMLDTLRGEPPEYAKLSRLSWSNPDAEHFPEAATTERAIAEALPTLNRGDFLTKIVEYDLEKAGGRLTLEEELETPAETLRQDELAGIERLLGEDFLSLAEARKALREAQLPAKKRRVKQHGKRRTV